MPDQKYPMSSENLVTAFNDAKGVVTVPELANYIEVIATGIDVWVALRDSNVNTADDGRTSVNLDAAPNTKAVLVVAAATIKVDLVVPGGKRTTRSGATAVFPETRARLRGFLHYKPQAASGTGRLVVNFYQ